MTSGLRKPLNKTAIAAAIVWLATVGAWMADALPTIIRSGDLGEQYAGRYIESAWIYDAVFGAAALCGIGLVVVGRVRSGVRRYLLYTAAFPLLWQASVYFADRFYFPIVRVKLADFGLAVLFLIGLGWLVWYMERRWREHVTFSHGHEVEEEPQGAVTGGLVPGGYHEGVISDPFHPRAWYYGRKNAKLHQSLMVFSTYSLLFFLACFLSSQLQGCEEVFDLPAGGGKPVQRAQKVQIQKKIVKKLVINPYSSIIFKDRNPDDVKINMKEITKHAYEIGMGDDDGIGMGGKNPNAKTRFIRIEYSGGDWAQDMELNPDLNLLIQYNVQTSQKIAEKPETMVISRLGNFKIGAGPPVVYMTGQKSISLTKGELAGLRTYLIDNHGMLFLDNGGGSFHQQAFAMMRQVAPQIEPVRIPLDDVIHQKPNPIPFLPYVAPHGGREAWGWKHEGRWIAYYHPGDIGDAWADGHSGVSSTVSEACYNLGVNVLYYGYSENAKWRLGKKF